jgi:RNA polymerase sigma factor (sigma-70 family)
VFNRVHFAGAFTMPQTDGTTFLRQLRQIVVAQCPSQHSDADLLRQFLSERDESSFAVLVRRHGPMVLGVCRSVLHHQQDAEDVFQATFLLLARKADSIRKQQSLSSWLHGVAYRLALKTRTQKSRRQDREQSAPRAQASEFGDDLSVRELRVVLHEELNRLPEKYRAPLLLCYWEGKTRDEAAERLGMTANALKKRLEQARNLLGSRLTRRGLAPSLALFTWLISENGARAAVSTLLIHTTAQAAVAFATVPTATVGASTAAVTLAQGALRTMFLTKCFTMLLTVLAVVGVGTALTFVGYSALEGKQTDVERVLVRLPQANANTVAPPPQKTDAERIVGTWRFTKARADGKDMPSEFLLLARLTFAKDGTMSMTVLDQGQSGKYTLGGAGKIDTTEPPGVGIFKFDGDDRLVLCLSESNVSEKRPAAFTSEMGSKQALFTLTRAKPGEEKASPDEVMKSKGSILKVREAAQRAVSSNNLRQIALAMHNYHDVYKAFPANAIYSADGKTALLSWRVAILPFIEQEALYREFKLNEPWDSAHNKKLIAKMPKIYADVRADAKNETKTYYQVFTSAGTAFDGNQNKAVTDFAAGTSNTALAAEAKDPVIWTQPADLAVPAAKDKMPAVGGLFAAGFHVIFADGSVRFLPRETTPAALRAFVIPKE